jgi:hypothetical protein
MPLSDKQKKVLAYCHAHDGKITKKEAMSIIDDHYCNGEKHVGDVLSRMVKAGLLTREKPGVFKIGKGGRSKSAGIENQTQLF